MTFGQPGHARRRLLHSRLLVAASAALLATSAWADLDGHGPDAWRVTGVAAGDVLNARMGPGTDYAVIDAFQPDDAGLQQVTCVPLVPQNTWMQMSEAQRQALPQPWCLMRSQDLTRAGWVARRFLSTDTGTSEAAAVTAASTATVAPAGNDADDSRGCSAPTLTAGTASTSPKLLETVQKEEASFTHAAGFTPVSPNSGAPHIDEDAHYTKQRFPNIGQSAFLPDADMGAIARAVLLFDSTEGAIPHARYRITYHLRHVSDDCDTIPRAYVEVTRFNLGPERYNEVTRYVDKAFWPPKETFGTQPHVSWRFAMGPVQGMSSDVKQASRRIVSDEAAAAADCLGQPCLALEDAAGPSGNWAPVQGTDLPAPAYREPGYDWTPGPVRVAEMLYAQAVGSQENIEASEASSFERPDMTLVISRDVQGQDSNTHGLLQWQGLMDDEISQIWQRVRAMPQGTPRAEQLLAKHQDRMQQPAAQPASRPATQATHTGDSSLPHELIGDDLIDGATLLVRDLYRAFANAQGATDNPFNPAEAGKYFFTDVVPQLAGHGADLLYGAQDFDGAILRIGPDPDQPMFRGTIQIEVDYRNFGVEKRTTFWLRADTERPGTPAPFRIFSIGHDNWEFP